MLVLLAIILGCAFFYCNYRGRQIKKFKSCIRNVCEQYDRMYSFEIEFYQKKSAYDWVIKKMPNRFYFYLPVQLNIHQWLDENEVRELLNENELKNCA